MLSGYACANVSFNAINDVSFFKLPLLPRSTRTGCSSALLTVPPRYVRRQQMAVKMLVCLRQSIAFNLPCHNYGYLNRHLFLFRAF